MNSPVIRLLPSRRGGIRKVLLISVVVLLVLVGVGFFMVPGLAAGFVEGDHPLDAGGGKVYTASIRDVSLSWFGGQKVGGVQVKDQSGVVMADLKADASASLFGILLGGGDVGTVELTGSIDVREDQLPKSAPPQPPVVDATKPAPTPAPSKPVQIPPGVKFVFHAKAIDLTFTPSAPGSSPVRIDDFDAKLDFATTNGATLKVGAASPKLDIDARANNLFDGSGTLTLPKTDLALNASIQAPGDLLDALVRLAMPGGPAASGATQPGPASVTANLVASGGRLKLADPSKPISIEGSVPASLVAAFAGKDSNVSLTSDTALKILVTRLDLPLPDTSGSGKALDLRGASLRATLSTGAIEGRATLAEGQSPKTFRVEPISFEADTPDLAQVVTIKGGTRALLDGAEAGSIQIDAEAQKLLDNAGAPRAGLPGLLRAEVTLQKVPTRLAEPFLEGQGYTLEDVIGPEVNVKLSARSRDENAMREAPTPRTPEQIAALTGGGSDGIPPTDIVLNIDAAHLSGFATLIVDDSRLFTEHQGPIRLEAERIAPVLRAVLRESGFEIEGDGLAILQVSDLDVPITGEGRPDLSRASAVVRAPVGGFTITKGVGDRPLEVNSIDTEIALAPDAAPRATIDWRVKSGDSPLTRITGDLEFLDLLTRPGKDGSPFEITADRARPKGQIDVDKLPSHLLGYLPENLRSAVGSSIGPEINIGITLADGAQPGWIAAAINVVSQGLTGGGTLSTDRKNIATDSQGLTFTVREPGSLARALMPAESPLESLNWNAPLTVSLADLRAALPEAGKSFSPGSVAAKASVRTSGLAMTLRDTAGAGASSAQRSVSIDDFELTLVQNDQTGASMNLSGKGQNSGQSFTMAGDIKLGKLFDAAGALNISTIKPEGRVELLGVPTVLAEVFDPKNGSLAKEAIGPTLDLLVSAPAAPVDPTLGTTAERSAAISLRGESLTANVTAGLQGKTVYVGPGKARVTLRPALVEAAMQAYAPDLAPRPSLARDTTLNADLIQFNVTLGPDNKPDQRTLTNIRATLVGENDIVLRNLPGGPDANTPLAVGVRALLVGGLYAQQNMLESEGNVKLELFDPNNNNELLTSIDATTSLLNPPPNFTAAIKGIDTARVDRWLGRPMLLSEPLGREAGILLRGTRERPTDPRQFAAVIESARLNTEIALTQRNDRYTLDRPAVIDWEMSSQWANAYAAAKDEKGQPTIRFDAPTKLRVELNELAFASQGNPLRPDMLKLAARAASPDIKLTTSDGQSVGFQQLTAKIGTDQTPGTLAFDLSTQIQTDKGSTRQPVSVNGRVTDALNPDGSPAADRARITANAKGSVPTAVLDALANQKGLLVDLLGGTTNLDAAARNLSKNSGDLNFLLTTDNARATLAGAVIDNTLRTSEPASITLTRITPELSARYIETVVPLMKGVEKSDQDEPATITGTNLTLPTDGNTRNLNGLISADLGTVRFESSDWFGELLKIAGGKASGKVGERIKPFDFVVRQGVVTYEKIEIPVGEFIVESGGTIDLNEKYMDIITFIPLDALADELARAIPNIPGISGLTRIPIRTHGPFGKTRNEPQFDRIITDNIPGALEQVIPKDIKEKLPAGIGDTIKDIFKQKKK